SVVPGSQAERAGVRADDVIEKINGQPAASMGGGDFYAKLYGGDHVDLVLRREGAAKPVATSITHPDFDRSLVPEGRRLEGNIGYIRLPGVERDQITDQYAGIAQQLIQEVD